MKHFKINIDQKLNTIRRNTFFPFHSKQDLLIQSHPEPCFNTRNRFFRDVAQSISPRILIPPGEIRLINMYQVFLDAIFSFYIFLLTNLATFLLCLYPAFRRLAEFDVKEEFQTRGGFFFGSSNNKARLWVSHHPRAEFKSFSLLLLSSKNAFLVRAENPKHPATPNPSFFFLDNSTDMRHSQASREPLHYFTHVSFCRTVVGSASLAIDIGAWVACETWIRPN